MFSESAAWVETDHFLIQSRKSNYATSRRRQPGSGSLFTSGHNTYSQGDFRGQIRRAAGLVAI